MSLENNVYDDDADMVRTVGSEWHIVAGGVSEPFPCFRNLSCSKTCDVQSPS